MEGLNSLILKVYQSNKIFHRPSGSPGVWLCFLIPSAVIASSLKINNVSLFYTCSSLYSLNIILNVIYLFFHLYKYKSLNVIDEVNIFFSVPFSTSILLYTHFLNIGFTKSFCYTISNALIYFEGLSFLLKVFPRVFTFGEANIAIQGFSLFMFNLFQKLSYVFAKDIVLSESDESLIILMLVLLWVLVFCLVPFLFTSLRKKQTLYMWSFSIVGIMICSIYYILNCNIFFWIFSFLMKPQRIFLIFMWLICSILAIVLVQHNINVKKKSNTIIRKPFHALIVMVFLPGILYDFNLLYFSSGCLLGLFLVLEVFRIMRLPPFFHFLDAGFKIYQDDKDCGLLALTPICLLIGQTIPLWLYPSDNFLNVPLPLLGGIFSVGVGDTFASIGGKFFGKHKWKGTHKSIEGTLFCVMSQVAFLMILNFLNIILITKVELIKSLITILIISFVEAFTNQIDNIVLPILMYQLFLF